MKNHNKERPTMYNKLLILIILCAISSIALITTSATAAERGKEIYQQSCKTCHNPSTAPLMKAPAVHDTKAWGLRIDAAKAIVKNNPDKYKNVMEYLAETVKKGKGAMVPGGMCVDNSAPNKKCTMQDYIAAIKFMSTAKKQ